MNITSVASTVADAVGQASGVAPSSASATAALSGSGHADSASLSGPAKMLSELTDLREKDPAQFKAVMETVADKLTAAAKSASDPGQQKTFSDLAAKFKSAGDSGDLSALQPSSSGEASSDRVGPAGGGPPPGGGGPPPGGGGGGGASSSSKVHDPADTNYDGKVSAKEQQAYEAKMAAAKNASTATANTSAAASGAYSSASRDSSLKDTLASVMSIVSDAISRATRA